MLPSIRKYGYYKLFDNPNNKIYKIENETDLLYKVVQYIRPFYQDVILIAGLGENQDSDYKRIDSFKKGYMKGQPNLMIMNNYKVSESQLNMKNNTKRMVIVRSKCNIFSIILFHLFFLCVRKLVYTSFRPFV